MAVESKNSEAAELQHQIIGVTEGKELQEKEASAFPNPHPDAQWFPEADLGLFLHWGISAVDGTVDLSWGMMADTPWNPGDKKITPAEYWKLAENFNPTAYEPELWLKAAHRAGFRYAVLTTKHHDGFALWPSDYGNFSTKNYLGGRDLVAPFVKACRNQGIKAGLYYSPPDWRWNQKFMSFGWQTDPNCDNCFGTDSQQTALDIYHRPTQLEVLDSELRAENDAEFAIYVKGQVEELLQRYSPDLIWFDGAPAAISIARMRELQPSVVVNPRMHGYGDYQAFECRFPETKPDGWWEMCSIWGEQWGYVKSEKYHSVEWMLDEKARVNAWGGNYLINVSPRPNGTLPPVVYERLQQLSRLNNGEN
jgi:alpha-L-fucosidase